MAYQMTVQSNIGLTVEKAYVKVTQITGDKLNITARLTAFLNQESADKLAPIKEFYITFTPNIDDEATNFIHQAYVFGKTLDEFADAIDC